jgi:hypothetical protein
VGPRVDAEIVPEHDRPPDGDREQTGEQPQEAGLPGAVRPADEGDLAACDLEVDPGEDGEAAQGRHHTVEDERRAELLLVRRLLYR